MSKPRIFNIGGKTYREVSATSYDDIPVPSRGRDAQEPSEPLDAPDRAQPMDPGAAPPEQPSQQSQDQWDEAIFAAIGYARDIDRLAGDLKTGLEKTADGKHYDWLSLEEAQGLKEDLAKGAEAMDLKVRRLKGRQVEQV